MLSLHDPLEEIRGHFREVWLRYSNEGEAAAGAYLDEVVRSYFEASDVRYREVERERLQSILMEEKRRWEDVEHVAASVAKQLRAEQCRDSHLIHSEPATEPAASIHPARPAEPAGSQPERPSKTKSAPAAPAGGLDLAGMIDGMLREERDSA